MNVIIAAVAIVIALIVIVVRKRSAARRAAQEEAERATRAAKWEAERPALLAKERRRSAEYAAALAAARLAAFVMGQSDAEKFLGVDIAPGKSISIDPPEGVTMYCYTEYADGLNVVLLGMGLVASYRPEGGCAYGCYSEPRWLGIRRPWDGVTLAA